eukprot:TRINITY_DN17309_c1_g1_i2.p1 TRINITY_DN17309_c1_g1~~TRINITY_DN17309_c1_g1_i2.p1  ORF type:complete len:145 (-),score=30.69 TRINITY_DN17309_c1_g1_i2:81-515(-)
MIQCRSVLVTKDIPKPAEVAHLKFLQTAPPTSTQEAEVTDETDQKDFSNLRVTFSSGSRHGDLLMRKSASLDSEEVAILRKGDVVRQKGRRERHSEVLRILVVTVGPLDGELGAQRSGPPGGLEGWVTLDATGAGGPKFLEVCD